MARCKICKGLHDVRADGLCGGCYDNRMAAQFGMSYGKYIGLYGHNLGRRVDTLPDIRRKCPVCGRYLSPTAGKKLVFAAAAVRQMQKRRGSLTIIGATRKNREANRD